MYSQKMKRGIIVSNVLQPTCISTCIFDAVLSRRVIGVRHCCNTFVSIPVHSTSRDSNSYSTGHRNERNHRSHSHGRRLHDNNNNSLPQPKYESLPQDMGTWTPKQMSNYIAELIYRSAYARNKLKEAIHEPSIEIALRVLKEYTHAYTLTGDEMRRLIGVVGITSDVERVELFLSESFFLNWYVKCRAPLKVEMHTPWDWFPLARQMKRRFIFHLGPTNSGKTHEALECLVRANSGVYCAPLKALASQVWKRIDASVPCDLLIGDERQFGGSAEHVSCTMEMTPVDTMVDVAVIDEIQMIEDRDRGWAWTRAVLGIPAKEIHLCGEARSLKVIQELLSFTKEDWTLRLRNHQRLVPLSLCKPILSPGSRDNTITASHVHNGDCIVAFSRKRIFEIKAQIEASGGDQVVVHVIYGGLPFPVREAETDGFNKGVIKRLESEASQVERLPPKHVLVTTDAIAYGLNMNVRRIVFSTMKKFDGRNMITLPQSTILQVGGRAGRFGMKFSKEGGFVTGLFQSDCKLIDDAFSSPLSPIKKAGLMPTADIFTIYAEMKQKEAIEKGYDGHSISFKALVTTFVKETSERERTNTSDNRKQFAFFPCDMTKSILAIAAALDPVAELSLKDRIMFCFVPLGDSSDKTFNILRQYAFMHANGGPVNVLIDSDIADIEKKLGLASIDKTEITNGTPNHNNNNSDIDEEEEGYFDDLFSLVNESKQLEASRTSDSVSDNVTVPPVSTVIIEDTLKSLEWIYKIIEAYGWLSWRFGNTFLLVDDTQEGLNNNNNNKKRTDYDDNESNGEFSHRKQFTTTAVHQDNVDYLKKRVVRGIQCCLRHIDSIKCDTPYSRGNSSRVNRTPGIVIEKLLSPAGSTQMSHDG